MRSRFVLTLALAALSSPSAFAAQEPTRPPGFSVSHDASQLKSAQLCGWFAVFQCAHNTGVGGPGRLISTDAFPNFRPGWFCRVMGPFNNQGEAVRTARAFGGYAKAGC